MNLSFIVLFNDFVIYQSWGKFAVSIEHAKKHKGLRLQGRPGTLPAERFTPDPV